ncbi:HpcH/HpaI aldolase/citrate lyase family protein [Flexibacterium corallicola]|uniref:HpcH/HpaI aldolase/citrate lyase family protein n=1 Tax=Flexibacterium corallicola TaxID=3037259 RepID=UPI00286ECCB1|nr:CoA ester lyase [Pseudovibrio sp. M1P-2-3]
MQDKLSVVRPRRSVLYMPGSNARALEKAKTIDADSLILDLEDAVAPDAKELARTQVCEAVAAGGYGHRELIIRINGFDTVWGEEDFKKAVEAKPDAILIPKINSASDLVSATELLKSLSVDSSIKLWAMMETPMAMLNAREIGMVVQEKQIPLAAFVMGTNDLSKDTGAKILPGRQAFLPWLMTCIAAARVADIDVIDGVYNNFSDLEGFEQECLQGSEIGMNGKTLIHPKQVDICNRAFAPSEEEVEWANKVIEAFNLPENAQKGALKVDGKMVERLHAEVGRKTVAIAEAIASRG